jgi:hypothetical protein
MGVYFPLDFDTAVPIESCGTVVRSHQTGRVVGAINAQDSTRAIADSIDGIIVTLRCHEGEMAGDLNKRTQFET